MFVVPRPLRVAGLFFANLFAATIGTAMIDDGVAVHALRQYDWQTKLLAEDLLSAFVAFALGYFGFKKLKSGSAKWVWVVGLCWFGQRLLLNHAEIDRMFFVESSYRDVTPTPKMIETWAVYTLPFVRTAFYSFGAFFASYLGENGLRSFFTNSTLDPEPSLSDDDPNAHPTPPPDMRDPLRANRPAEVASEKVD